MIDKRKNEELFSSYDWYDRLGQVIGEDFSGPSTLGLIEEVARGVDSDCFVLFHIASSGPPRILLEQSERDFKRDHLKKYLAGLYVLDPFYNALAKCAEKGLMPLREVIDEPIEENEYYCTYFSASGSIDEICFCSADGSDGYLLLSLSRRGDKGVFVTEEIDALRRVSPLVCAVQRAAWSQLALSSKGAASIGTAEHFFHKHVEDTRRNFGKSLLTKREYEVLQLMLYGDSVRLMSKKLHISEGTTKVHRKSIYSKLKISSHVELFSLFLEAITSDSPSDAEQF